MIQGFQQTFGPPITQMRPDPLRWIPAILDPFSGRNELVKFLLMNLDTMFQVDSNAVSVARKRYKVALLILNRLLKRLIEGKRLTKELSSYTILSGLSGVQELRDDVGYILIDDLQHGRFINHDSYLASDVVVSAAAQLIIEDCSSFLDSVYNEVLKFREGAAASDNIFCDYFDPEQREDLLLPIIKEGLENRIRESRAMKVD